MVADANGLTVQAGWLSAAAGTPADWSNLAGHLREACPSAGLRSLAFGSNSRQPLGGNPATVGSTLPDYGRDALTSSPNSCCDNAGVFRGGPLSPTPPCNEHRSVTTGQFASGFQVILLGDVITYHEEPPLGLISDPGALFARTLPPNSTRFYSFDIAGDATDLALHFLDIDTEASETDVAMGIFDSDGNLIASDDNSGSGTNAQLSFGVGRRAGVGDGQQYDGRSGQLAAGTYYLAVGASGTTFADGFTATPGNGPGGDFTLNFHTNVNGTPLAPSVPPLIPANHDFDAVFGPVDPNQPGGVVRQLPPASTGINGVIWDRVTLAGPIDSSHFLTLAYDAPLNATAYIFSSTGSLVYAVGPQVSPRFDIGGNGPFNPPEASAGLPAGTYYLATALSPTDDLRAVPPGGRWHVRGRSASNADLSATLYAGQATPACNPDVNQDGASDQGDIDYLINAIAGGGNPNNIDTDFNHDGASDQTDVDALINVVAGGPCP